MGRYEDYIKGLKGKGKEGDFDRLKSGVEARVGRRKVLGRLSTAGALALIFIGFVFFYNLSPYFFRGNETYADYIFDRGDTNGDQVLSYVFTN